MIAAAPDLDSRLGLLSVILQSVSANRTEELSGALRAHAVEVLRAAAAIGNNPGAITAGTSAEAIELAWKIHGKPDLLRQLDQVRAFDAIRPEMASELLRSLRSLAA